GDSAFFVWRTAYEQAGGFRPLPLFEDLDLLRRLKRRGRFVRLRQQVTTSSRRFEGRSFVLTFAWWTVLQVLYWVGVPPRVLGRLYAPSRGRPQQPGDSVQVAEPAGAAGAESNPRNGKPAAAAR